MRRISVLMKYSEFIFEACVSLKTSPWLIATPFYVLGGPFLPSTLSAQFAPLTRAICTDVIALESRMKTLCIWSCLLQNVALWLEMKLLFHFYCEFSGNLGRQNTTAEKSYKLVARYVLFRCASTFSSSRRVISGHDLFFVAERRIFSN